MRRLKLLAILTLPLVLLSCDSNDDDGDNGGTIQQGTFQVTITGGLSDTYTGAAVFSTYTDPETNEPFFVIQMVTGTGQNAKIAMAFTGGDRPSTGQYPFIDYENFEGDELPVGQYVGLLTWTSSTSGYVLIATSGTITLTTSTNSRVAGSFQFPAAGWSLGTIQPLAANVTAQFDAVFAPNVEIPEF